MAYTEKIIDNFGTPILVHYSNSNEKLGSSKKAEDFWGEMKVIHLDLNEMEIGKSDFNSGDWNHADSSNSRYHGAFFQFFTGKEITKGSRTKKHQNIPKNIKENPVLVLDKDFQKKEEPDRKIALPVWALFLIGIIFIFGLFWIFSLTQKQNSLVYSEAKPVGPQDSSTLRIPRSEQTPKPEIEEKVMPTEFQKPQKVRGIITGDRVNFRKLPEIGDNKIGQFDSGTEVEIIDELTERNDNNVLICKQRTAFRPNRGKALSLNKGKAVKFISQDGTYSLVSVDLGGKHELGKIMSKDLKPINGKWYKIKHLGKVGWVYSDNIYVSQDSSIGN